MIENEKWDYMVKNSKKQPKKPIRFVVSVLFFCVCLAALISSIYAARQQNLGTEVVIEYLGPYGFTLNSDSQSYTLAKFNYKDREGYAANIPAAYKELPVTAIGTNVFDGAKIASVTIPENVTSIGSSAFKNCDSLTEINYNATKMSSLSSSAQAFYNAGISEGGITVNIGENVENIPSYLFYVSSSTYKPNIKDVFMGDNLTTIGSSAFSSSASFAVHYPGSLTDWCNLSISGLNYLLGSGRDLYVDTNTKIEGVLTIPAEITSLPNYAFYYLDDITSINLSNVINIGNSAFYYCSGVTGVLTIPSSVTTIGSSAFYNCTGISGTLTIPNKVASIGSSAFSGLSKITELVIPNSVTSIGSSAFYGLRALTTLNYDANITKDFSSSSSVFSSAGSAGDGVTVTIGDDVTNIPGYLFYVSSSSFSPNITNLIWGQGIETIGKYSFGSLKGLETLNIPNSVLTIGDCAFYYCSGLTEVVIGSSVTKIGERAFYSCGKIISLTIPESVISIGNDAFAYCYRLTEIKYNATNVADLTSSSSDVFYGSGSSGDGITVTIGNNVEKIPAYLFDGVSKITNLIIGTGVTSIGDRAFYDCTGISSVEIPASMQKINDDAFYNCKNLAEVTNKSNLDIVAGDKTYGYVAYYALKVIEKDGSVTPISPFIFTFVEDHYEVKARSTTITTGVIEIPAMYKEYPVTTIPASAFSNCTGITSLTIPESIISIGEDAFDGLTNLTTLNYNATNVADFTYSSDAFRNAGKAGDGITVTIGNNVTHIPAYLFYEGSSSISPNITSLTIGTGVESIGNHAFDDLTNLTTLNYNANISTDFTDESNVFENAGTAGDGITVTIGNEVTNIPAYLFCIRNTNYIPNITSLTIGTGVKTIGSHAFGYCDGLTSVTIGAGVESIGDSAFFRCDGLTELIIPESVISIGNDAFGYCDGLTSVTIGANVESIGNWAFSGCSGLTSVTIGTGVKDIGSHAFYGCSRLTSVTIGAGVTSIGSSAFDGCSSLNEVIINSASVYSKVSSSYLSNEYLTYYIKTGGTIKVLQSIDDGTNTYLGNGTKFTLTIEEIDGVKYNVYTKI